MLKLNHKNMKILVINSGSTSFKFAVYDAQKLDLIQSDNFKIEQKSFEENQDVVDKLFRQMLRSIPDVSEISHVGHRVVHGGNTFQQTTEISPTELIELEKLNFLAPLHNPFNLAGIKSSNKYITDIPDFAVFDTAFYKDLPEQTKTYPIPYKYYEAGIVKFGFHGTSHKYVCQQACEKLKLDFNKAKLISIHLGGGCSITAVKNGKAIETSMGFTPLEGLMMQTRSGDIDPGIIFELIQKHSGDFEQVKQILNKKSGILGISNCQNFLELLEQVKLKEERAQLAFDMFIHRIKKYIGAYLMLLDGADAIIFTGAIGAGDKMTRNKVCDKISMLSNIKILAIETDEEMAIAEEIKNII